MSTKQIVEEKLTISISPIFMTLPTNCKNMLYQLLDFYNIKVDTVLTILGHIHQYL